MKEKSEINGIVLDHNVPADLKFRPIMADQACETYGLSSLISIPFLKHLNINFLSYIPNKTDKNVILVSLSAMNMQTFHS